MLSAFDPLRTSEISLEQACLVEGLREMIGVVTAALLAATSTEAVPLRTAFMCSIDAQRSADSSKATRLSRPMQLAFLLSGTKESTRLSDPIEVFDPDRLLQGGNFQQFARRADKEGEFALRSTSGADTRMMVLNWKPRDGNANYDAVLGLTTAGVRLRYYHGFCIPFESEDTKKDFDAFKAEGGFK